MHQTLHQWHDMISTKSVNQITTLLADDVVMHSPVVHTPIKGKQMVTLYLTAAFHVFLNDNFTYVREVASDTFAVLEFTTEIEGIKVNGVDMITWNTEGQIIDFKVMVRPLKAINIVHQQMGALLEKFKH